MRPLKWTELRDIRAAEGCKFDRQRGDHYIMTKPGLNRPVVIPKKRNLKEGVVLGVLKTIGLSKTDLLVRLGDRKKR